MPHIDTIRVGLVDADLLHGGTRHPNLVLLKIAGFLKDNHIKYKLITKNDEDVSIYHEVYVSRVFTFTPLPPFIPDESDERRAHFHIGGTGEYAVKKDIPEFKSYRKRDMHQLESDAFLCLFPNHCGGTRLMGIDMARQMPDYHLYDAYVAHKIAEGRKPSYFNDYLYYSIGFLTRGCVRHCAFCVNKLEKKVYRYSELEWFLDQERDENGKLVRPYIYLWDDNFLAADKSIWKPMLEDLMKSGRPFQFRQGLDERILAESEDGPMIAEMLSKCKYHGDYIFAFDNWKDRDKIVKALKIWKHYNPKKSTKFYLFCGFTLKAGEDSKLYKDVKSLFDRIHILMQYGCFGYVMRHADYKNHELSNIYVQIARWCNQPQFYRYMSFWEYCYRNQSFWEQKTKKLDVPNQIPFDEFEKRFREGFYTKDGIRLCKTLRTLMEFIERFPTHRTEILEMMDYKLKDLTNPNLWD